MSLLDVNAFLQYLFYAVFYGGAFAVPLIITSAVSLEFWEFLLGQEAHYPFKEPGKVMLGDAWFHNFEIGFAEEIVFRGPVVLLAPYMNPVILSIISSAIFGLAHYSYGIAKIPSCFTSGMILCAIALHFGLPAAIVAHMFLDLYLTFLDHAS